MFAIFFDAVSILHKVLPVWVVGLHCSDLLMQACRPARAPGRTMAHVVMKLPTNMANVHKLQIQTTYIIHIPAVS